MRTSALLPSVAVSSSKLSIRTIKPTIATIRAPLGTTTATDPDRWRTQAPRPQRPRAPAQVHADQRRGDRLQGPEPAAAIHLRSRQDPLSPRHRPLEEAPAAARP